MVHDILSKFLNYDEQVRDIEWATEMVRVLIRDSKQIMSKTDYDKGHNILFGDFPDADLKRIFSSDVMTRYKDKLSPQTSIYLFERTRNAIIDDRTSANLRVTVNSLDPEKEEKRQSDKALLENRKGIEGLLNDITGNNGMPPQRIDTKDFHGNIDEFDDDNGNDLDPAEVKGFMENSWGLKMEIFLQNIINAVLRGNQLTRKYDKYINDIMICLHNCTQVFVDEFDGGIKTDHLYPYQVWRLGATEANDNKSDQGVRVEKSTNVRGFLQKFGTYFNTEESFSLLLSVVNGGNGVVTLGTTNESYTGIHHKGELIWGRSGKTVDFAAVLDLPIQYGYGEWKVTTRRIRQHVVTKEGNIVPMLVDVYSEPVDGASKEIKEYEETYRAYYLNAGSVQPKIIKWGRVYMQPIEGVHDEYSGFTIKINSREGIPFVNILKPFWNIMNISFKMFEMLINDIKPDGFMFNHTSLVKIAQFLQNSKDAPDDIKSSLDDYIKMVENSPHLLTTTPTTPAGDPLGGGNLGVQKRENGLNNAAGDLIKIMDWVELKVATFMGTQGIEMAEPRDGYKLTLENRRRTRAATAFIDFILLNHIEDISITVLNYAKDISKFKDIPAYKYLEDFVGYKVLDFLSSMKKAPHRYGTFLDTFNNDMDMEELRMLATEYRQKGEITLEQWVMLKRIDNLAQATSFLAKERRKTIKQNQMEAMAASQRIMEQDAARFEQAKALEDIKGQWREKAEMEKAKGFYTSAQINSTAQLQNKAMSEEGQNQRQAAQAQNDINKIAEAANIEAQKPVT